MISVKIRLASLLVGLCGSWVLAADWQVGMARTDVTPTEPTWMCGYSGRDHPSEGALHPLWAKALVIEDQRGERVAIITTDLVGFAREGADRICAQISQRTGLERKRIVLNSSHTHCGPLVAGIAPVAYRFPPERQAVVDAYTRQLEDKIVELVVTACGKMRPANLAYGEDACDLGASRRKLKDGRYAGMGVNLEGPFEKLVPVLRVSDENGEPLALVFGYGCHNTTLGAAVYQLNGDYAGYAQIALEEKFPDVQAMFVIGCGGDSNPRTWCCNQPEVAERFGKSLAEAVERGLQGPMHRVGGPLTVAFDRVDLPFARPVTKEELEKQRGKGSKYEQARTEFLLELAAKHGEVPTGYACPVQVVQFGNDVTLIALSGETCVGYALRLRQEFADRRLWIAGYSNEVFAYVPTERVLAEGGFEAATAQIYYGWPSPFAAGIEDRIVNLVKALVARCENR